MAKRLINNAQELMDRAQEMRIDTEGKSIQDVAQEVIARLMNGYDEYYMYIDNYKQMKQAEQRNHEIDDEVASIKKTVAIIEEQEDTTMMNANETTATNNNATIIKEETDMRELITKAEQMISAAATITKTSDAGYVDKKMLAQMIHDLDKDTPVPSIKKNTRPELIQWLKAMVDAWYDGVKQFEQDVEQAEQCSRCGGSGIFYTRVENNVPVKAIPDDGMCYRCNGTGVEPIHNAPQQEVPKTDARAKTDKLFALIKACAVDNNKKGYGFTISSFMLQACILNAGAGVEKFKGHTVTEEEAQMTKTVYQWLLKNNYVKPIVYSVAEDEKVRVYMDGYTGRTDSAKTKMIPYSQSKGYTAKKVTSFLVTLS